MPFSESLAARIRDTLVRRTDIAEQKMFGGLCFLLRGNILVGVRRDSLIARLGEDEASKALKTLSERRRPFIVDTTELTSMCRRQCALSFIRGTSSQP